MSETAEKSRIDIRVPLRELKEILGGRYFKVTEKGELCLNGTKEDRDWARVLLVALNDSNHPELKDEEKKLAIQFKTAITNLRIALEQDVSIPNEFQASAKDLQGYRLVPPHNMARWALVSSL